MRGLALGLALLAGSAVPLLGGSVGTSGAQFLELPSSARTGGLAGAGTALARGVEGLEYNPGRLALLAGWDVAADHLAWAEGVNLEQLAVGWGRQGLGGGLQVLSLSSPDVPATDASGALQGTFKEQDLAVAGGAGWSLGRVSVGVTGRWIQMALAGYNAHGVEGDLGLAWQPYAGWRVGLVAQHWGVLSAFGNEADPTPLTLRQGLGWEGAFDNGLSLSVEGDAVEPRDGTVQLRGGAELGWGLLFLRVGGLWSQDYDARQTSTLGAGVKLGDVTLDYAFADLTGLGATQRFGLSWRPGATLAARPQGVPGHLRALRSGDDLLLAWTPVAGSQGYWVYLRRAHGGALERVGKQPLAGASVRLKRASSLGDLGLAVSSVAEDGSEGPRSDELRVASGSDSAEALEAPQALRLHREGGRRSLSWVPGAGGGGQQFQVLWSRRSGSAYVPLSPPAASTQAELDPAGTWGSARFFVVRALRRAADGRLQESPLSEETVVAPR